MSKSDVATAAAHLSQFGEGNGPRIENETLHVLDAERSTRQSNAAAFDVEHRGAYERRKLQFQLRVSKGGDGGSILFLNTRHYGKRGPAPFLESAVEPNLKNTFAVGIDIHNPKNEAPFGPWGNYRGEPQREISLHFDGRELVKRVAPKEFRGDFVPFEIVIEHEVGGADVTVRANDATVFDRLFVAGLQPSETRLAFAAGTREKVATEFDIKGVVEQVERAARKRREPLHVEIFNHVLTNNAKTAYKATVDLPPLQWALGRVILTLEIHDAGKDWDEWDRNGEISVIDDEGKKLGIVPFITSYRTPCHWKVDVTHFRPLLTGMRTFEIAAGTTFYKNRGYMMSVSLDYYHGANEYAPVDVVPLWVGTAKYKSDDNHFQDFFQPRRIELDGKATRARIFTTTTGHSQVGEFTRSSRAIVAEAEGESPATKRFENTLWKDDCYLNPNRPQFGTWKYSRAGWAPGDVVRPWWIDLSPMLASNSRLTLTYLPSRYVFKDGDETPTPKEISKASHVVRSYLILYADAKEKVPAPTLRIASVAKNSNAMKAGILRGDYLASYDGTRVDSTQDLIDAIQRATQSGAKRVRVVIVRGVAEMTLEIDAGKMGISLGR